MSKFEGVLRIALVLLVIRLADFKELRSEQLVEGGEEQKGVEGKSENNTDGVKKGRGRRLQIPVSRGPSEAQSTYDTFHGGSTWSKIRRFFGLPSVSGDKGKDKGAPNNGSDGKGTSDKQKQNP